MAIKDTNTRIIITISKDIKTKLEAKCEEDKRTISKEVEYILEKYLESE